MKMKHQLFINLLYFQSVLTRINLPSLDRKDKKYEVMSCASNIAAVYTFYFSLKKIFFSSEIKYFWTWEPEKSIQIFSF